MNNEEFLILNINGMKCVMMIKKSEKKNEKGSNDS